MQDCHNPLQFLTFWVGVLDFGLEYWRWPIYHSSAFLFNNYTIRHAPNPKKTSTTVRMKAKLANPSTPILHTIIACTILNKLIKRKYFHLYTRNPPNQWVHATENPCYYACTNWMGFNAPGACYILSPRRNEIVR